MCEVGTITAPSLRTPKFVNRAGGTFGDRSMTRSASSTPSFLRALPILQAAPRSCLYVMTLSPNRIAGLSPRPAATCLSSSSSVLFSGSG